MSAQLLRDPNTKPTSDVIAAGLGAANAAYLHFINGLHAHEITLNWRYYTDGNAWLGKGLYRWAGPRGGQNEVTAFWLSIWENVFKVTLYIPEKARADALRLPLGDEIKAMIHEARQVGKLKFFPLTFEFDNGEAFDDLYALIDFRKQIKK